MRFRAITTCSAKGWEAYGQRMVQSYWGNWPGVPLTIYSEDALGIATVPFPGWLAAFHAKHGRNRKLCGYPREHRSYDYRFDALRFSYKTAAVIDAGLTSEADYLIWVDADTVTHAPVTLEFLESLVPGPTEVISWLYRTKKYPECGFYILSLNHSHTRRLLETWQALYERSTLFQLPEWHDSFVLAELVRSMALNWRSISGGAESSNHPFINGPLGAVMDHMKGPRKDAGRSRKRDLVVERDEPYWKGTQ